MTKVLGWAAALALGLAVVLAGNAARAALGAGYGSVETDRLHLGASSRTTAAAGFAIHTLTLPNHGQVNEYTRADGVVFAITWRGPGRPDLRQLLGSYFDRFRTDNALVRGRRSRMPLHENRPDFKVRTGGHPGAFFGAAFLPRAAPAGFSTSSLR
jgi:hypothetical protein